MAKIHGKDADVWVNGISTEDDANRIAFTISPDTAEVTSFASLAKESLEGLYGWTFSYAGYWNGSATFNDPTFWGLIGGGGKEIKVFPGGSVTAAGKIYYWGTAILTSYGSEATQNGPVTCTAEFLGSGCLSRATAA